MQLSTPVTANGIPKAIGAINYIAPALILPCSRNPDSQCYMVMNGHITPMDMSLDDAMSANDSRNPIYKGIEVTLTF